MAKLKHFRDVRKGDEWLGMKVSHVDGEYVVFADGSRIGGPTLDAFIRTGHGDVKRKRIPKPFTFTGCIEVLEYEGLWFTGYAIGNARYNKNSGQELAKYKGHELEITIKVLPTNPPHRGGRGMRELLEKLEGVMPRPWALKFMDDLAWMLAGESYDYIIKPGEGDVGLAPLTALLKQSFVSWATDRADLHDRFRFHYNFNPKPNDAGMAYGYTEFEAVALAYLSLRPKEAR